MESTDLFAIARKQAEQQAVRNGGSVATSQAAFAAGGNGRPPRDPERIRLHKDDVFQVPADQNSDQWLAAPLSQGGKPVLRLLAKVQRDGGAIPIEVFCGTFAKTGIRPDGTSVSTVTKLKDGRTAQDLAQVCVTSGEFWSALFGKTFKVTSEKRETIKSRTRDGMVTTRDTMVYTIEEV